MLTDIKWKNSHYQQWAYPTTAMQLAIHKKLRWKKPNSTLLNRINLKKIKNRGPVRLLWRSSTEAFHRQNSTRWQDVTVSTKKKRPTLRLTLKWHGWRGQTCRNRFVTGLCYWWLSLLRQNWPCYKYQYRTGMLLALAEISKTQIYMHTVLKESLDWLVVHLILVIHLLIR